MSTPEPDVALLKKRKSMIEQCLKEGYAPYRKSGGKGSAVREAAKRLGETSNILQHFVRREEDKVRRGEENCLPDWSLYNPEETVVHQIEETVEDRIRERRLEQQVTALQRREKELLDRIIELEDVRGTVFELKEALGAPEVVLPATGSRSGGKRTAVLHISDVHCGEAVDLYEMDGLNSYNEEICRARMKRMFQKTASLLTEHWKGDPVEEVVICLGGDMIDGNLREESRRGGAMAVVPSVKSVSEITAGGLEFLYEQVGAPMRVYTSPGNHSRLTPKPHINEGNIDNLDILVSWGIEKILGHQDWAKFYYSGSGEMLFNTYGWWFLLQHGHEGVGGSGGLYGPVYKQVRGMYRTHQSYSRRGRGFHYVLQGHDHTPAKIPFGFANGSVVGYNPFAMRKLKADPSPATQNLLVVEEKLGVITWNELFLGTPNEGSLYEPPKLEVGRTGKPVMRVQAGKGNI